MIHLLICALCAFFLLTSWCLVANGSAIERGMDEARDCRGLHGRLVSEDGQMGGTVERCVIAMV